MLKSWWCKGAAVVVLVLAMAFASPARAQGCAGDCNGNDQVSINELITCVNIALGSAQLAACAACDVNGNGTVAINELIAAVNAALNGCNFTPGPSPTATPTGGAGFCGDHEVNVAGEECDDGNNVGGDGCAANCTNETTRPTTLDSNMSLSNVQGLAFKLTLKLSGTQALTGGSPRDTAVFGAGGARLFEPGEFPIVVKAEDVKFNPIDVPGLGCACVRAVPVPEFGPGISGIGKAGCGENGLSNVDFLIEQDHDTTPNHINPVTRQPGNSGSANGLPDDPDCMMMTSVDGTDFPACFEGQGPSCSNPENRHMACWSPRTYTFSGGPAGPGSVLLLNSTEIQLISNAMGGMTPCTTVRDNRGKCLSDDFGPDCTPCTEDDPKKGTPSISPTTSGTASVLVYDANDTAGTKLGFGVMCGNNPCVASVTGAPTDCEALKDPNHGLTGALVTAFPGLDLAQVGDTVITTVLKAAQP
jgi:cysteine-rich repeat protein